MNPERLLAGKAVEETGQSPLPPGSSEKPSSSTASGEPQTPRRLAVSPPRKIPQILFEDDEPPKRAEAAFTRKFELGARLPPETPKLEQTKLPEAYGTGKLLLTARDPHTLFAHWDLTNEQQRHYNSLSEQGRLALRAYAHAFSNQPAVEIPAQPDSRHVFVRVSRAGTSYIGELGYYQPDHHWKTIATSAPTTRPSDAPSEDTAVVFSTVPQAQRTTKPEATSVSASAAGTTATPDGPPSIIPVPVPRWPFGPADDEGERPTEAEPALFQSELLRADAPPFVKRVPRKEWTALQERLLADMIRISSERREWISSAEIIDLVRGQSEPSEMEWPFLQGVIPNISSPVGGERQERKGFWFNVNAELVIYGSTDAHAQVTVAGRPIKLRPDGTFSCHFALPDGDYDLTAVALSPENETRQATMNFRRHTEYSADVGAHPQNPFLEQIPQPQ
jgi:hypothetical protein